MRDVNLLIELQNVCDLEAEAKKKFRESALALSELEKIFSVAEKLFNTVKTRLAEYKNHLLEENLQLASIEEEIKKWNKELFSTHNSNPKYLRDIESKIKENETAKSKSEDKVLELMDLLEKDEKRFIQVEKDYHDAKNLLEAKQNLHLLLDQETHELLEKFERKKADIRVHIDKEWLDLFDKSFLFCQGKAISILNKGTCQICKFTVPTSKLDQLYHQGSDLHFCDNCKRIILVKQ